MRDGTSRNGMSRAAASSARELGDLIANRVTESSVGGLLGKDDGFAVIDGAWPTTPRSVVGVLKPSDEQCLLVYGRRDLWS